MCGRIWTPPDCNTLIGSLPTRQSNRRAHILLIIVATVARLRHPSVVDIYLDASSWLVTGLTLGFVVARAVFAPGVVTERTNDHWHVESDGHPPRRV